MNTYLQPTTSEKSWSGAAMPSPAGPFRAGLLLCSASVSCSPGLSNITSTFKSTFGIFNLLSDLRRAILRLDFRSIHTNLSNPSLYQALARQKGSPGGSYIRESACNSRKLALIPGSGRSPGGGSGNPLQYSRLENSTDGEAWQATVYGVTKRLTLLATLKQKSTIV